MNKTIRMFLSLAVLLIASLGASLPAAAQGTGRSVAWQRFDVDLAIESDGSVNVVDTQAIRFTGTYQQGYDWCHSTAQQARATSAWPS